jgi:hypothetical protein
MGPNDAELIRVFTSNVGSPIGDFVFRVGSPFEVRVDVEAGVAVAGMAFRTNILIFDFMNPANPVPFTDPNGPPPGFVGNAIDPPAGPWPTAAHTFVYNVPAPGAGRTNNLCQVHAWLLVGGGPNFDTSFAASPTFFLTS